MGWKCGCQPFSCRCSQNVTHCRKETCSTCLFKESIPATPFGNFNHPLPARSRFLRATVRSTCSALWLHHAHLVRHVCLSGCLRIHSRHSFWEVQVSTPCWKLEVSESDSTLYQLCIMLALCLQKIPFLCRRFWICVSCREA